jgi:hypothetical protein
LSSGPFVFGALLAFSGPFFPPSLVQPGPRADTRRCAIGADATQSDCALIASQWVVTTAGAVATARPVDGRLRVRIGDDEFAVDQLVYHPKWNGGVRYDVTLLKLVERVPAFPVLPLPGEFPVHVERVAQHAMSERQWVNETIGPSAVWDARGAAALATKQPTILTRMRSLMDVWSGRASND